MPSSSAPQRRRRRWRSAVVRRAHWPYEQPPSRQFKESLRAQARGVHYLNKSAQGQKLKKLAAGKGTMAKDGMKKDEMKK